MSETKYAKVKEERLKKDYTCKDMVELINPLRIKRGAKPITQAIYYKKEKGEIPVYIEEAFEIANALGKSYKIFFKQDLSQCDNKIKRGE